MRHTSVFVTIAFLAGLAIGFLAYSTGLGRLLRRDTHAADQPAIEKLHQDDIKFTLSQAYKELMNIWSEDAVRFMPGSPPNVGKQAIQAANDSTS